METLFNQLMQQWIELQQESIALQKEGIHNLPNDNTYVRNLERPTIASDSSDGDWALFINTWGQYSAYGPGCNPKQTKNVPQN